MAVAATATTTADGFSPAIASFSSPENICRKRVDFRFSTQFYKPLFPASGQNPTFVLPSLRTTCVSGLTPKQKNRSFPVFVSLSGDSGSNPEEESSDSIEGHIASTDIKLPRRSLLVQFTCNSCGERTDRLINRLAYEKGLVVVQCGGCLRHHKLVDNLGLIVEYDFRKTSKDLDIDQV